MPQVVDIPEIGEIEFPDSMSADEVAGASHNLWSNRNAGLKTQQQAEARKGNLAERAANTLAWGDFLIRPFASTPENPTGWVGSALQGAGMLLNETSAAIGNIYKTTMADWGIPTGRIDERIVEAAVPVVAAMVSEGALTPLIANPAVRAASAFGAVPAAQTLAATGDTGQAIKSALVGAAIPGVAQAGREAAAVALGKAVEMGVMKPGANTVQKIAEAFAAQGAVQTLLEGSNLPEYLAMTPEERQQTLLENVAVNSAFLIMDVPNISRRVPSATQERIPPVAKVGEIMEKLVNDPAALDTLRQAADEFALAATDPHNAQVKMERSPLSRSEQPAAEELRAAPAISEPTPPPIQPAPEPGRTEAASPRLAAQRKEPIKMTFEQFLKAPREGELLERLRTLPKPEPTPEQVASKALLEAASAAIDKAGLGWIYDRAQRSKEANVAANVRRLPKAKQKLVEKYDAALNDWVKVSNSGEAGQRRLFDRAVEAGIIAKVSRETGTAPAASEQTLPASRQGTPPVSPPRQTGVESSPERATLPRRIEAAPEGEPATPISLADIRESLATALDIPVRVRGFAQHAVGIFKQKAEVIRQKLINDVPTLAHEAGHYLHWILFPQSGTLTPTDIRVSNFAQRFDPELMALGKPTSRPSYTKEKVRREGVAEFVREWLTDQPTAMAKAPGFATFFEAEVKRKYPEVWKILKKAQADIRRYVQQPGSAKLDSIISVDRSDPKEPFSRLLQRFSDNWIDDLAPIKRSMQRLQAFGLPPALARIATDYAVNYIGGWRGKAQADLFHRQTGLDGRDLGPSLRSILSGLDDLQPFRRYLVARRALEKAGQGKTVAADQPAILDAARAEVAAGAQFEGRRQKLLTFQRNARNLLLESGLLSPSQVRAMDALNEDYVPFHRVYESVSGGKGTGEGFINLGQGVRTFKGSDRQIIDPLESIVKNVYLFRDLAERNRVGVAFTSALDATRGGGRIADAIAKRVKPTTVKHDEVVQALKNAGIETEGMDLDAVDLTFKVWRMARQADAGKGIFTVWKNGEERPYQLDDPELFRALSLADSTAGKIFNSFPLARVARTFTRTLRAGATLSPEFIARNPFRDQLTAAVYSRHGYIPFWDGFRGVIDAVGRGKIYWDWVKAGGRYSDFVAADRTDLQSALKDVVREPTALRFALDLTNPLNVLTNLQKFSEFMEQATRISEFRRAKANGASDVQAANDSKEVTLNFARAGFRGKAVNQIAAFFNASVQDWNKLFREHNYARDPKRAAQVQARALLYITLPSLMTWWLGKDDERIQNLPTWRKNFFWNVNVGPLFEPFGITPKDFVISFPKPFLLGQLYGSSVERGLDYATDRDPNAVRKWGNSLFESTPVHPLNFLPTALRPAVETASGHSFFTGQQIENQAQKALPPDFRIGPSTSVTAQKLAELMPWEWATPLRLDNLARGYFGSLARYGTDASDYLMARSGLVDVPEQPEKTLWERPVLRAFARSPYEASDYVRRFFDGYELAEQRINALRKGPEFIETEQMRNWARGQAPALFFYLAPAGKHLMIGELRQAREDMGMIIKAMAQVKSSRDLSSEAKADKLRTLAVARDEAAELAFKMFVAPADRAKVF